MSATASSCIVTLLIKLNVFISFLGFFGVFSFFVSSFNSFCMQDDDEADNEFVVTWVNPVSSAWGHLQIGDSITAVDGLDLDNDGAVAYANGLPLEQGCSFTDYINEKHVGESVQVRSLLGMMLHQHAGEGLWWLWIVLVDTSVLYRGPLLLLLPLHQCCVLPVRLCAVCNFSLFHMHVA